MDLFHSPLQSVVLLRQLCIFLLRFSQLELKLFEFGFCASKIPSLISVIHFVDLVAL